MIVNTQIERDADFRDFVVGVWNYDSPKPAASLAGGV